MNCICNTCKLDKIPSGCGTPIKEIVVVKGIGAIECKRYEEDKRS